MTDPIYSYAKLRAAYPPAEFLPQPSTHRRRDISPSPSVPSAPALRLRQWLEHYGSFLVPAIRAAIAETKRGERHLMLRAIAAQLVPRWRDADIRALVMPAALEAWPDVDPAELLGRLEDLLTWIRRQEAAKSVPPMSERAPRLAAAFGAGR